MPNDQYRAGTPWRCPSCSRELRVTRRYLNLTWWGTVCLTLALVFLLGFRGIRLVIAAALFFIPVNLGCTYLLGRIWPPPLELYPSKSETVPEKPKDSGSDSSSLDLFHH